MAAYGVCAFVTLVSLYMLKLLAPKLKLLDNPGGRKIHCTPTPVIGGIAIFLGLTSGYLVSPISSMDIGFLLAACAMTVIVGALDDAFDLRAMWRLAFHLACGGALVLLDGDYIDHSGIPGIDQIFVFPLVGIAITTIFVATAINAINLTDGIDGLAAGISLGITSALLIASHHSPDPSIEVLLSLLTVSTLIFLCFNFRFPWRERAEMFLGDAGSTLLGIILAWVSIKLVKQDILHPLSLLWIFAIPLNDTISVILKRKRSNRPIFQGGKDHFHHLLIKKGYSVTQTSIILTSISALTSLLGIFLGQISNSFLILSTGYLLILIAHIHFTSKTIPEKEIVINFREAA